MSTKFSIRPAPRKKPWICHRSPPCLPTPFIPTSLLCTFSYDHHVAPPPDTAIQGSIIIQNSAPTIFYVGSWSQDGNSLTIDFTYDPVTHQADAFVQWFSAPYFDQAAYPMKIIAPPPKLLYQVADVEAAVYRWSSLLTITC